MEDKEKNKGGRPPFTPEQIKEKKEVVLRKLQDPLSSGLSVDKALRQAQVSNHEFYKYLADDEVFGEKIALFKQVNAVMVNSSLVWHLRYLIQKQNGQLKDAEGNKKPAEQLDKDDLAFLQWVALNNNNTKGEWGERKKIEVVDPEVQYQKMKDLLTQHTTKDLEPLTIEGENA